MEESDEEHVDSKEESVVENLEIKTSSQFGVNQRSESTEKADNSKPAEKVTHSFSYTLHDLKYELQNTLGLKLKNAVSLDFVQTLPLNDQKLDSTSLGTLKRVLDELVENAVKMDTADQGCSILILNRCNRALVESAKELLISNSAKMDFSTSEFKSIFHNIIEINEFTEFMGKVQAGEITVPKNDSTHETDSQFQNCLLNINSIAHFIDDSKVYVSIHGLNCQNCLFPVLAGTVTEIAQDLYNNVSEMEALIPGTSNLLLTKCNRAFLDIVCTRLRTAQRTFTKESPLYKQIGNSMFLIKKVLLKDIPFDEGEAVNRLQNRLRAASSLS